MVVVIRAVMELPVVLSANDDADDGYNIKGKSTRVPFTLTLNFWPKFTFKLPTFNVTVLVHEDDFVLRPSLVTRMENVWPLQSAVNWYLHMPWKLKNFPSNVL